MDKLLFDEDDILAELLLKQQTLISQLEDLLESASDDENPPKPKPRFCKRNDRYSKHWETECQMMTESSFIKRFRVSRDNFQSLLNLIGNEITATTTFANDSIPSDKRLAVTLRYLATGGEVTLLSDLFGIGESSVRLIIKQTVTAIAGCPELQNLVKFPTSEEEFAGIAHRFFDRFQFPNTIGAVDDTHIPIMKPAKEDDPASYLDYKKHYSIHLQAVCDADTRILFYHIGAPGKNNDGGVMELSGLKSILTTGRVPARYHLVGDPAFPLHVNLMTRFPGVHLTEFESRYNWRQSRARMIIEQLFGLLKGRFRVLLKPIPIKDLNFINLIVKACVLLHNFLLDAGADSPPTHRFLDSEYFSLMDDIDQKREAALAEAREAGKKRKKRKQEKPLPPQKSKRLIIANSVNGDLSESNCCKLLGM